jgi:hypothetical protein
MASEIRALDATRGKGHLRGLRNHRKSLRRVIGGVKQMKSDKASMSPMGANFNFFLTLCFIIIEIE